MVDRPDTRRWTPSGSGRLASGAGHGGEGPRESVDPGLRGLGPAPAPRRAVRAEDPDVASSPAAQRLLEFAGRHEGAAEEHQLDGLALAGAADRGLATDHDRVDVGVRIAIDAEHVVLAGEEDVAPPFVVVEDKPRR